MIFVSIVKDVLSSGWRKTELSDLKMGRGALPEEEGSRQSLCRVNLHSIKWITLQLTQGAISQRDQMEWCTGPAWFPKHLLQGSQAWGDTGTFALILHLKPPGAFCFECDQAPTEWGDFLLPTENTLRRELLNLLEIRDNLPVTVTGVKSSLKWTWWWYHVQEQKTLLYHLSAYPQYEKCSFILFSLWFPKFFMGTSR